MGEDEDLTQGGGKGVLEEEVWPKVVSLEYPGAKRGHCDDPNVTPYSRQSEHCV